MHDLAAAIRTRQTQGIGPQHETQVVAASLALITGEAWASLCCWCLEKQGREDGAFRVYRGGGECCACPYVGRDCLVAPPAA